MPTEIYLLKVGMTMTEGSVAEWYVPDGSNVVQGERLYALETEKVEMDVEAPATGTVRHLTPAGVALAPATLIGYIFAADEEIPPSLFTPDTSSPLSAPARGAERAKGDASEDATGGRIAASPTARRLARELGIELDAIRGSGPGGRVVEADIRAAHNAKVVPPRRDAVTESSVLQPVAPLAGQVADELPVGLRAVAETGAGGGIAGDDAEAAQGWLGPTLEQPAGDRLVAGIEGERVAVRGVRKLIAERMHESLRSSAQLTMDMEVAMDEAVRLRARLIQEWQRDAIKPSYTDLVIKATAKALRTHPRMNAHFVGNDIVLLRTADVGLAIALEEGLVVAVIREADRMTLKEIAAESSRLATSARAGTLLLDEMNGGSFTVTSLGMYGVDSFTPILNVPQVGILGVNRLRDGVRWEEGRPVRQQTMCLSLTWDHRALDGVPAAQFLGTVRDMLQAPYRLLV